MSESIKKGLSRGLKGFRKMKPFIEKKIENSFQKIQTPFRRIGRRGLAAAGLKTRLLRPFIPSKGGKRKTRKTKKLKRKH